MNILFGADVSFNYFHEYPGDVKIKDIVKEVKPLFDSADFKMLNLENVFGEKTYEPIVKSGPNLISTGKFILFLKELKPQAVGMANNHTGDYGPEPIFYTFDLLKQAEIEPIGVGENIDKAYAPCTFEKGGICVSVIAVCENEFGTAGPAKAGSAGFHLGRLTSGIRKEKEKGNRGLLSFFMEAMRQIPIRRRERLCFTGTLPTWAQMQLLQCTPTARRGMKFITVVP